MRITCVYKDCECLSKDPSTDGRQIRMLCFIDETK